MLVTEFARTTQAFAVESVEDIARLDWNQVMSAESSGAAGKIVTSIARLDGNTDSTRLAGARRGSHLANDLAVGEPSSRSVKGGRQIVAQARHYRARSRRFFCRKVAHRTGTENPPSAIRDGEIRQEAWDRLNSIATAAEAEAEGKTVLDKVALVLADLEMPEMDGFTLTRNIKQSARFSGLPVVIHCALSGSAN